MPFSILPCFLIILTTLLTVKILKISPGASYIFQRPFFEGLIRKGAYIGREICIAKIDWVSL